MRLITLVLLLLAALACTSPLQSINVRLTPTPARFEVREAVYRAESGNNLLKLTLEELTLLASPGEPDIQVLAVLANGQNAAYLLFPSNQPGVPETTLQLSGYPLYIQVPESRAHLWVLVVRHRAFAVAERTGMLQLTQALASRFNNLVAAGAGDSISLASIVNGNDSGLLEWFGEIEVLGDLVLALDLADDEMAGEHESRSPDGGIQLAYNIEPGVSVAVIAPPGPRESTVRPGYRLVIDENFDDGESVGEWFTRVAPTYSATLIDGAYQIKLISTKPEVQSWGGMQNITFAENYIVEARMRVLEEGVTARYGLWLHYTDDNNFLYFGLENSGKYRIARVQSRSYVLVPWGNEDAINRGTEANTLEVKLEDGSYTMTVNGISVVETSDEVYDEGQITFFCYAENPPATCRLEQLKVWIPESAPAPVGLDD